MSNQKKLKLLDFQVYPGNGDAVLFLHGLGSRGQDWQPQIDALKDTHRIITIDFPGHGKSAPARDVLTMKDLAAMVNAVLDELKLSKVHVIGLSLGGMVAFQLAVDYPHLLHSMVIVNSAPGPGDRAKKLQKQLRVRKWILRLVGFGFLAKKIAEDLFPQPSQQVLRQQFMESIALVDKPTYLQIVNAIAEFNLDEDIRGCEIPALVLTADQDYTSVGFKQNYVDRMNNARLVVVPNSRHASPLDSPDFCNREIKQFLPEPP